MDTLLVNSDEMEGVLFRLQCVHATLLLIHGHSFSKPLYCAADELTHITDEFGALLENAVRNPETEQTQ